MSYNTESEAIEAAKKYKFKFVYCCSTERGIAKWYISAFWENRTPVWSNPEVGF